MNKRNFLKSITGQSIHSRQAPISSPPTPTISLAEYSGEWTISQAHHLLSRTCFGIKKSQLEDVINNGMNTTVDQLIETQPVPDPPRYYKFGNDPLAGIGEVWHDKFADTTIGGLNAARTRSTRNWFVLQMLNAGTSIHAKMMLFWYEHMPVSDINIAQYTYDCLSVLHRNALGNFRTLLEEMTINSAMLVYLNGDSNVKSSPNENYARELLELFSIGRGEDLGDGDYTNYTEKDIAEIARALTGWRKFRSEDGTHGSYFTSNRHDQEEKILSNRLGNAVISNEGEDEYKKVIDIILEQDEVARFISRKIHIFFLGKDITSEVEANIIEPLAAIIRNNDYNIKPAISTLLRSEYFYDESIKGCMINNPYDFLFKMVNSLEMPLPDSNLEQYSIVHRMNTYASALQMLVLDSPTVAGWKPYYQEPQLYEFWINSATLRLRELGVDSLINGVSQDGVPIKLDFLGYIEQFPNASDPNLLITEVAELLFPFPLSQNQIDYLKEVLIPGLPDFEWTVEYSEYLSDPTNNSIKNAVQNKLASLFGTLLKMPEIYLQ